MKVIKYQFLACEINYGTEDHPNIEQVFLDKSIRWSEANEETAKWEAYNGEYTIEDDGQPEPVLPSKDEDMNWDIIAEAITEGVNEV